MNRWRKENEGDELKGNLLLMKYKSTIVEHVLVRVMITRKAGGSSTGFLHDLHFNITVLQMRGLVL